MKKVFLLIGIILAIIACKKSDNSNDNPISSTSYFPLAKGNYWIYKEYEIDTNSVEAQLETIDSINVTNDTIINGKKYYVIYHDRNTSSFGNFVLDEYKYVRDSSGYLVKIDGGIVFSVCNFTDALVKRVSSFGQDTLSIVTGKMEKVTEQINVPAGSFNDVLNLKGTVVLGRQFSYLKRPHYVNNYYAKNVGLILKSTFELYDGTVFEVRLLRYKINN